MSGLGVLTVENYEQVELGLGSSLPICAHSSPVCPRSQLTGDWLTWSDLEEPLHDPSAHKRTSKRLAAHFVGLGLGRRHMCRGFLVPWTLELLRD